MLSVADHLLIFDTVADVPVHLEEAVSTLPLLLLSENQQCVYKHFSDALKNLEMRTVNNKVRMPEFIWRLSNAIIAHLGCIALVTAFCKLD